VFENIIESSSSTLHKQNKNKETKLTKRQQEAIVSSTVSRSAFNRFVVLSRD